MPTDMVRPSASPSCQLQRQIREINYTTITPIRLVFGTRPVSPQCLIPHKGNGIIWHALNGSSSARVSGHDRSEIRELSCSLRTDTPERHRFDSQSWKFLIEWRSQSEHRWTSVERGCDRDVGVKRLRHSKLRRACHESDSSGRSTVRSGTSKPATRYVKRLR